ncbi:MAG: hypothetical protein IJH78_04690 [Clostridia bacterium]|nr:hypothetical protein [Clostridia bacterium]
MLTQDCEVIQDLIMLGGRSSRASMRLVTDHIRTCPSCRELYQKKRGGLLGHFSLRPFRDRRDTEQRYMVWSILALSFLTSLICMIVNFAVEHALTWGWIAVGGIICCTLPALIYVRERNYKFLKAMIGFSVLSFLLLGWIQFVLHNLMHLGGVWIWRAALPIAAIWLSVLWIGVMVPFAAKQNGFFAFALIFLLAIPADIASAAIAAAYTGYTFRAHWSNLVMYVITALVMALCGIMFNVHAKKRK